jgi:hypothetical protein
MLRFKFGIDREVSWLNLSWVYNLRLKRKEDVYGCQASWVQSHRDKEKVRYKQEFAGAK